MTSCAPPPPPDPAPLFPPLGTKFCDVGVVVLWLVLVVTYVDEVALNETTLEVRVVTSVVVLTALVSVVANET